MSAPAGWHLQPDGQERYWDGTQWTEQFRTPVVSDPTAPPPAPSWADSADSTDLADSTASSDHTQTFDVPGTQALPTQDAGAPVAYPPAAYPPATYPPAGQQQAGYPQQGYGPQAGYPQPGYSPGQPQTGYGAPGAPGYPPPQSSGSSGLLKGCLIAGVVLLGLIAIVIAGIAFFASRVVDEVNETFPSGFPTELPSGIPTELPSGFPTDLPTTLPTEGIEQDIELAVGDGFELPRATIAGGWTLERQGAGIPVVNITGMKATLGDANGFPVLFTMSFPAVGGDTVETVCTAPSGEPDAVVDVSCVPLFGDVGDATRVTVTAAL